ELELKKNEANDRHSPAPHRTERTDFPYSALRTHSSASLPACRCRQSIESIMFMQLFVGIVVPQSPLACLFAPEPAPQARPTILLQRFHHLRAVAVVEISSPAS